MLIQNFLQQHDQDVQRMHDQLEALRNGASDDIFQTRASPFEEELPLNVAINLEEASGVAANTSILQHRLRSLLPIKQGVMYAGPVPPKLISDVADHFRQHIMKIPWDQHSWISLEGKKSKVQQFIDDVWKGKLCRFPDALLRRLFVYSPERWNLDSWIATCLVERILYGDLNIPRQEIEKLPLEGNYPVEKTGVSHERSVAGVIALLISMYLSKVAVQLAAWLPYELVVVQSQDSSIHADFISGNNYWDKVSSGDFFDDDFRTCLDHVLQWMEYREWHDSLQHLSEEVYYEFFWRFLDQGTEECAPSGMTRS
ncbi:MAG: hypothetical protein Q9210_003588 [Variospora velana]